MKIRAQALLLIVVLSMTFSILTANFLVTILGWRFTLGLSAPLGDIESLMAYVVLGALIFPHLFGIPYMAMILKNRDAGSAADKNEVAK